MGLRVLLERGGCVSGNLLSSGGGAFSGVWGSSVNFPIGVWGGAPAALQPLKC